MPQVTLKKIKNLYGSDTDPKQGVSNAYMTPPDAIKAPPLMYVSAVRNSGKSFAVSKLMRQAKKDKTYDRVYLITPTWLSNKSYFGDLIKVEDVLEPTKTAIDDVVGRVEADRDEWEKFCIEKKRWEEFQKLMKGNKELNESQILYYFELGYLDDEAKKPVWKYSQERPPQSCCILDDILSSPVISQSSSLSRIASLNRHIAPLKEEFIQSDGTKRSACGMGVIIISQTYSMSQGVGRVIRENCTNLMLFKNKQEKQLAKIRDELGSSLDVDKFDLAYELATKEKYGFLLCDFNANCPTKAFRKGFNDYIVFQDDVDACACSK